ncbi:integral peroxisomal membrane peroxin-domain-containing protein [Microdochium trichocladiopsis]|uniref:Integral peroxisomal membrane peroxin-domain-containing protein n=1 Tax=Microdochium trichocladiopsis TaxID=1682393 RepID=A0A9P9BHS5_9PEZI|nr:integral peroxisomal membrane peroxin-domain-containing protein [Microdochium trichocladiopsis]KAH7020845.1 integral peroxisomal membrane peroxin-domain-containing protein [Microdochium trichocladiopsis]
MAAIETPWMDHMSTPKATPRNTDVDGTTTTPHHDALPNYAPPTYASFSPANLATAASAAKRRSTILVHQKSPLLLATPPQVTRALAYSHPFLLPLNKLVGLLTWTTSDPWESFLLLAAFWATVLYGDVMIRLAGPIVTVLALIGGMYSRRYSPLSSSGWAEHPSNLNSHTTNTKRKGGGSGGGGGGSSDPNNGGHQRAGSEATSTRHQKTLDEIVETLKLFTSRCNILMEPLLEMTDFLSTSRTATSATTRPALTTLFVRLLAITPFWVALTLPPWRIITTKRVALIVGTLLLSWHSRPAKVSRTLLWRSATVRQLAEWVTGLEFDKPTTGAAAGQNGFSLLSNKKHSSNATSALTAALKRGRSQSKDSGVRFTFILYENQRRWVALGWTSSLFAYERAAWTDEQNNPLPSRDEFELPEVEDAPAKWRWVEGSRWRVDGVPDPEVTDYDSEAGKMGWVYYDNKWQQGRRGLDGWGRWTRRRKWYRDAELVEKTEDDYAQEESTAEAANNNDTHETASSPPPPALPPRARSATRGSVTSQGDAEPQPHLSSSLPDNATSSSTTSSPEMDRARLAGAAGQDDAASTASSSGKSRFRFPTPSLRRRTTGGSMSQHQQQQSSSSSSTTANNPASGRPRRTSEASSIRDDDPGVGSLTPALELEIQGHHRELGSWGVGDDVQMGLE